MKRTFSNHWKYLLAGSVLVVLCAGLLFFRIAQPDQNHQRTVDSALRLLTVVEKYQFSTTVEQRVFPAPLMSNAGRSSELEIYNIDGWSQPTREEMLIRFWQESETFADPADALEVKYEDGLAYSRTGQLDWQLMDDQGGFLAAPGKNPASFLVAAKRVDLKNRETIEVPLQDGTFHKMDVTRYSFDLDGTEFAVFMRDQMVLELQRSGKLPGGMTLELSDKYRGLEGSGDAWIDEDGMLVRLLVEMTFPQEANGEHVEARISTTFFGVAQKDLLAAKGLPAQIASWLQLPATPQGWAQTAFAGSSVISILGTWLFLVLNARRRWSYTTVAVLVMISMLVGPLWSSHKTASFAQEQAAKQNQADAEEKKNQEQKNAREELFANTWQPHVKPSQQQPATVLDPQQAASFAEQPAFLWNMPASSDGRLSAGPTNNSLDTDGDGLTDEYEDQFPNALNRLLADTDSDGLFDGEEMRLGLLPGKADSDGDQIADLLEVSGFYFDTGDWYSNPDDRDTDMDGVLDGVECPERSITAANPASGICRDTDSDRTPDVFDPDDDGDDVPTLADESPYARVAATFTPSNPLIVTGSGVDSGRQVDVTYQFRPLDAKHLTYTQNVLDWPSGDAKGQIQRVEDTTFEDFSTSTTGSDARAANGDLRLVPMAEVRFKGTSLPLKLTDRYTFPFDQTGFQGEIELTAVSSTRTRVTLTDAPVGSHPIYLGVGSCDDGTGYASIGSLAEGQSVEVDVSLGQFADGSRPFQIRNAAGTDSIACQQAYPKAHGAQTDRVVDDDAINPYGIFARTDADTGEVVLYSPLQLVYNEAGSMPAAFSLRLPLTNEGNRFNTSRQEVRLIWILNAINDVCKPIPADWDSETNGDWCNASFPDRFVHGVTRMVNTYPEEFTLTGLSISEQRGVKLAVVFENPAVDDDPNYSDPLWALSKGLEGSFMSGRAVNGARDLTIEEIRHRFDPDANTDIAVGDDRLWGLGKDDFRVVMVDNLSSPDGLVERMQTLSTSIFNDYYSQAYLTAQGSALALPEKTLLLFAREVRERSAGLNPNGTTCTGSTCAFDLSTEGEMVQAVMSWSPYQRAGADWEAYPMDAYLDWMEANLRSLPAFTPGTAPDLTRDVIDGKIEIARMYAEFLYRGLASLIEINGAPVVNFDAEEGDPRIELLNNIVEFSGSRIQSICELVAESFVEALLAQPLLSQVFTTGTMREKITEFFKFVSKGFKEGVNQLFANMTFRKAAALVGGAILVAGIIACTIIAFTMDGLAGKITGRIVQASLGLVSLALAIKAGVEVYKAVRAGQAISSAAAKASIVGMIVGIVIAWAMFFLAWGLSGAGMFSLAFNDLLADAIAMTMTIVLMTALSLIFPVGTVIAAVIAVIDALIMSICAIAGASDLGEDHWVNKYVCKGISGLVATAFKWFIYGANKLINYEDGTRLEFGSMDQIFERPGAGFVETNNMKVILEVTNNIQKESRPIDWKSIVYFWQWSDSNAMSANFQYRVQTAETDFHDGLERGGMTPAWTSVGESQWSATVNVETTGYAVDIPDAGINRVPPVYMSEASAIPVQECFAIPPIPPIIPIWIPVCYLRTERATLHTSLSDSMTMDVFPATLSEFYELAEVETGGYSFAWGVGSEIAFPVFQDADGDTLISVAHGGNDPNDSLFDSDNDGLSDSFEVERGYNPNLPDSDRDDLLDAVEVRNGTDPMRPDSDGDGLTDAAELEGWFFNYGFTATGAEKRTNVTSEPLMVDTDMDGLTDKQEQVYGFNPRVFSNAEVLTYAINTQEADSPQLLLQFEEDLGAFLFTDRSNSNFHAACAETACPTSGFSGRYGRAVEFDGGLTAGDAGDFLEINSSRQALDFTNNQPFTLAFWMERHGGGTLLSKWSETAGERPEFRLDVSASGILSLTNGSGGSVSAAAPISEVGWTHVAVRFDGTVVTFIINGVADASGAQAWSNPAQTGSGVPLLVGAVRAASGLENYYAGMLDELIVYTRALTESEVTTLLLDARYNINDSYVRPGEFIEFLSNVSNLLNNRFAYGLLTNQIDPVDAVVDAVAHLLPRTFTLYPDTPAKLNTLDYSEQLQINPAVTQSGDLTLGQTVNAQIVDRQTESNFAEMWLKFNEATGATSFEDFSGGSPPRTVTCTTCPLAGQPGILGTAVQFTSGSNATLDLPSLTTLNLLNRGFTVSMWIKPATVPTAGAVIDLLRTDSGTFNLALIRQANGTYVPQIVMDGQTWDASAWRSVLPDVWNHLVLRYNNNDREVLVYLNGAKIHTRTNVDELTGDTEMWLAGNRQQANISIDDLRIYSRPLSVLDINRLAERPVLEMNMDDPSFTDTSGNSQTVVRELNNPVPNSLSVRGTSLYPDYGSAVNFLRVNGNPLLNMQDGAFTFSVWIYPQPTADGTWQGIYGYDSGTASGYPTLERRGTQLRLRFGDGTSVYTNETDATQPAVTENRWNHVVVTFEPNTDPANPNSYLYRLYVNAQLIDGDVTTMKPASAQSFYVGHSSHRFTVTPLSLRVDSHDDAGSAAEVTVYRNIANAGWGAIFGESDVYSGNTYGIDPVHATSFTTYSSVEYHVWEDDVIGDDFCGGGTFYYYHSPAAYSLTMSNGINGALNVRLDRQSMGFYGRVDELSVYRYALDGEQIYNLYNSIPLTARLPLDERPASDTFVNTAEVTTLDDGTCTGVGCPSAGILGLLDQAVQFDGSNDVISVPDRDVTSDYMATFWLKTTCANCGVVSLYPTTPGSTPMHQIYFKNGNVCGRTGGTEVCSTGGGVNDGRWHPVVYWNNGSRTDLWVDGEIVDTRSGGGMITTSNSAEFRLGYAEQAGDDYFTGLLDDVRVFRYTLPAAEVRTTLQYAPILRAHLDEPKGAVLFEDSTQNGWRLACSAPGCPEANQPGRLGGAIELDGVDDLVTLASPSLSAGADSFTVSLWVKPSIAIDRVQTLWTLPYQNNSSIRYSLAIAPNSMKLCLVTGSSGMTCTGQSQAELIADNWNFVTLVVERLSSSVENYSLYLNGYIDTTASGNTGAYVRNGLGRMTLGGKDPAYTSQAGGLFIGELDEVIVSPYPLNEINVRDSFNYQIAHVEEVESVRLTIDAEAPAVSLTGFDDQALTYMQENSDLLKVVSAVDPTSGIGLVEMRVDHRNLTAPSLSTVPVCEDSIAEEGYCATLRTNTGDGRYTVSFRAVDRVGHQTTSPDYSIYADGEAPRIVVDIPAGSLQTASLHPEMENTWVLDLSGSIEDPDLGGTVAGTTNAPVGSGVDLSSVLVSVVSADGAVIGKGVQQPVIEKAAAGPGYVWHLQYLLDEAEPSGHFSLVVQAMDHVGNRAKSMTDFSIDATPPAAVIDLGSLPEEDEILTQRPVTGTVTDLPGSNLPYTGANDPSLAVNVDTVQLGVLPVGTNSFLFNEPYPDGLLLWLPLDKAEVPLGTGGIPDPSDPRRTFMDLSPSQISGACEGAECPAAGLIGHRGASTYFDGDEQAIQLGNQVDLSGKSFTVAVWSKRVDLGHNDPILWQGPLSLPDQRIVVGINAQDQFVCGFGGSDLTTDASLADTGWHFWACTFDLATGRRAIFQDGKEIVSDTAAPLPVMYEPLVVGRAPVGSFQGYLDELQIFGRAVGREEMRNLFAGYQSVFHLSVLDKFETVGDELDDQSGFFHPARLWSSQPDRQNKVIGGASGAYGLRLDGNDWLAVALGYSLSLDRGKYTLSAWVKPEANQAMDVISQMDENPEWRYPSLSVTADLRLRSGFGDGYDGWFVETADPVVQRDEWSHLAVTFDGQWVRFYVNGRLVGESQALAGKAPYAAQTFNIGQEWVGGLDEVMVFPRVLSPVEIAAQAQHGWSSAALALPSPQTTWTVGVPGGIEGLYQVGARGWDVRDHFLSNYSTVNQWDGTIDTLAPRILLERTQVGDDLWDYQFSIEDVFVDEASIRVSVCDSATLTRTYNNSRWLLASGVAPNTMLYRIEGACQGAGPLQQEVGVYACDVAGNCSAEIIPPRLGNQVFLPLIVSSGSSGADYGTPSNLWLERGKEWPVLSEAFIVEAQPAGPELQALTTELRSTDFRSASFFPIKGSVYDASGVARVEVRITRSGVEVYRTHAAVIGERWTAMWAFAQDAPPAGGIYQLEITAIDKAGNVTSITSDLLVNLGGR